MRWTKPKNPNAGFSREQWSALPPHIELRLVDVVVPNAGFRTKSYTVATTLADRGRYRPADLAALYRRRWEAELYLRSIKETMGFARLRALGPAMVQREIAAAFLAYNLLRGLMAEAAARQALDPSRISMAAAIQSLRQAGSLLHMAHASAIHTLLQLLADFHNPDRPGRTSPRAIKRRQNKYPLLNKPRHLFKETPHRARYSALMSQAMKSRGKHVATRG